ncbi:DnaJ domain-containing protein [Minwuia sp.]|uniref:DnaJ domain-containing protein n=1 Tax=Minwuia sp. TaxID=2493630 RepID=UPI003A959322
MSYLILGLGVLIGGGLLAKLLVNADPKRIAQVIRLGGGLLLGAAGLLLTLRGAFFIGAPLAFFGLMLFARGLGWQGAPGFSLPGFGGMGGGARSKGGASSVRTRYLEMSLDHDSGEMDGLIREGRFQGNRLSELDQADLEDLLRETRLDDPESARLVEAYLDRAFEDWRGAAETESDREQAPSGGPMSRREALEILELSEDATEDDIREAHRRQMKRHHPDQGGSAWYAAKLNQAKDLLLQK